MVGVSDDVAMEVKKHHLRLAFACEGGGGGDMRVKREKKTRSGSLLRAREVEVVTRCRKREKKTTSGSLLRAREVGWRHVVENVKKRPPPARFCVRGRWLNMKKIL